MNKKTYESVFYEFATPIQNTLSVQLIIEQKSEIWTQPNITLYLNIHICHFRCGSSLCPPKVLQLLDSHAESDRVFHPNDDSFVGQVQCCFCCFAICLFIVFFFMVIYWFFICLPYARPENSTQFWHLYLFQRAPVSSPQCVLSYNRWTREGGQNETMDGYGLRVRLKTEARMEWYGI